ncbi:myo-inosose-2 dehydratase [Treponema phagedenis]|uniref:myo-inosose-2 dehydratase n=1 Tax=Treponema phagedenis TaxID=162 RepID=UPI0001F63EF9|nr:myo-inosose-2 dehydratase [Treponema phagedenis]EFW37608.1 AP endonuclease, family 2 [Treponema phagedenis F0421]TYT76624.1 myo-inosose-2 dehydratase [Treponema phagedenis]
MFDSQKVHLGIAPIAWTNDDMPDLGKENSFEQCISEMALAGFKGTEIGNKYPRDPAVLKKYLDIRGLRVASAWFSAFLTTKPFEETKKNFIQHRDFLHAMGAKVIVVSEQGNSIQGQMNTPVFEKKHIMNDSEWKLLCEGLNKLGELAKEKGMKIVYHHHMGTVVQTTEEVDRMMSETNPELVYLLYDTGHLVYSGEDHIAFLKKYVNRIKHVHLKDIRPEIVKKIKNEHLSFLQGVRLGAFTVPGDGCIDFDTVFKILAEHGYEGWLLVEAEQDPALANPFEYAVKARSFIKGHAGI